MSIVGRTYYERGRPVLIVVQWRTGDDPGGPRNVRIRREDGSEVVRPFRGLRRDSAVHQPVREHDQEQEGRGHEP
jgi:acetyl esterase